jgi:hypothetical protein
MTSQGRGVLFDLELQTATWWLAHNTLKRKVVNNALKRTRVQEDLPFKRPRVEEMPPFH